MPRRIILNSLVLLVCLSATGTTTWADHRRDQHDEVRQHAADLANHSRELYDEVRLHFRGEPFTARALSEAMALYRSARRMTAYADAHSSPFILEREAQRMETEFHNLEQTLRSVGRNYGPHWHIRRLMGHMDDLVHHIHQDVHDLGERQYGGYRGNPVIPASASSDLGPRDWYFGGGGFTVRLGR